MKKKTGTIFFTFFICLLSQAQKPEQLLSNWSAKSPIEKVYLHFDRDNYIAGETAWFKAYLYSDYQPDTITTITSGTEVCKTSTPHFGTCIVSRPMPARKHPLAANTAAPIFP